MDGGFGGDWPLNKNVEPFPSAFADYASTVMPRSIREALIYGEYLFTLHGVYSSACDRLISYFVTPTKASGKDIGTAEKEKYQNFFEKDLKLRVLQKAVGMDFAAYGNSFNSMLEPFDRYLVCPGCRLERPFQHMKDSPTFKLRWNACRFEAKCPDCDYNGVWRVLDRKVKDSKRLKVKRWNPKYIDLRTNPVTESKQIIWRIPEEERQLIRSGYDHILGDTPWEVIECVRQSRNLLFNNDEIYHWREEPLAGLRTYGWGLPRSLSHFRGAWYMTVLHRVNEAIGMDYVIPTRLISPAPGKTSDPEAGDLLQNISMGDLQDRLELIFRRTRRDPAGYHISPIPLQYQLLGGDAKSLVPSDLLDQAIAMVLNNIGIPVDFYKFALKTETAPLAARMLAAVWACLVDGLNGFTQWVGDRSAKLMSWERADVKMDAPVVLDVQSDPSLPLALASQKLVSPSSALERLGFDFRSEQVQILDDEHFVQERQAKQQEEMDQAATMSQLSPSPIQQLFANAQQQSGGAGANGAAGGAPGGGAAGAAAAGMATESPLQQNQNTTPQQVEERANQKAQSLMQLPEGQRKSELLKLKQSDPLTHSRVRTIMEEIDQAAAMQGKSQIKQQQYGQP